MIYPGVFILFTEYVEGETIAALARSLGGVEEDGARSITRQILSGVEHIHRQGLIHHDIKGENILISSTGCVKIADAGMTRIDVSDARVLASPFLAPEVYMTVDFDCAIDIWSVGAVIVELLTGRHPWADASVAFLLLKAPEFESPDVKMTGPLKTLCSQVFCSPQNRASATTLLSHPWILGCDHS
ncbi:kinase-like domain-containing protein [Favolaschia claudopus]|uniref:Kinase-like domain-containing protein n=1 Tax=Favolaschia claudopus TaxID=2862362 RepID=A0AAW0B740_9AGAR